MSLQTKNFLHQETARLQQENKELNEEVHLLRDFVEVLDDIFESSFRFKSDDELLPLLRSILTKAMKILDAPDGSLALLDDKQDELVFMIVEGTLGGELDGYRIPAGEGIAGWVVRNQKPALVRNVRTDFRFSNTVDSEFKFRTQSIIAVPLIGNRKIYGVVEILNQKGDQPFNEKDVALLRLLCRAAGEALADIESQSPITE